MKIAALLVARPETKSRSQLAGYADKVHILLSLSTGLKINGLLYFVEIKFLVRDTFIYFTITQVASNLSWFRSSYYDHSDQINGSVALLSNAACLSYF